MNKERFEELKKDNRIWFGKDGKTRPYQKLFLSEVQQGIVPTSLWLHEDAGHTVQAKSQIRDIFNDTTGLFDTPKPTKLIERLIKLAGVSKDEIVLDFFAGSATTAHAVVNLNDRDDGNRRWICIQLPEITSEDSEAYKAGYKNIAQISRERIRRAGEKIGKGDIGFKAFALEKSNYRQWNVLTETDDEEILSKQVKLFAEKPLVDSFDKKSVVYEILEKEGFDLNANVIQENGPLKPWVITEADKKLVITFAIKIDEKEVENLKLHSGDIFVCFDNALNDTLKSNLIKNLVIKTI